MTRRRSIALALAGLLAIPVLGLDSTSSAQAPCTWEIGSMGALSGDYAYLGQPIVNGIELAIRQANEAGDLACELALYVNDSQGDPNQAVPLARDIADRERAVACLCPFFSGESLATGSIFERAGMLMVSTGTHPSLDDQGFRTWFRAVANDHDQATSLAKFLRRRFLPRRVVIVRSADSYGRAVTRKLIPVLDWRVREVLRAGYDDDRYEAKARRVRSLGPDLVVFAGFGSEAIKMLFELREAGYAGRFATTASVETRDWAAKAKTLGGGGFARGAIASCACSDPRELRSATSFARDYEALYGRPPTSFAGDMNDIMTLVVDVLRSKTPGESIESIRADLVRYFDGVRDHKGIIKSYTWERDGDLRARGRHTFMWRWLDREWVMRGSVYGLTR